MIIKFKNKWQQLKKDNRGLATVEIVLILLVLIGILVIFKKEVVELINDIFDKVKEQSGMI